MIGEVDLLANGDSMEERAAGELARDRAAGVEVTPGAEPTPVELEPAPEAPATPMVDPGNIALVAIAGRLQALDEHLERIDAALIQLAGLSDVASQVAEAVKSEGLPGLLKLLMAAARS